VIFRLLEHTADVGFETWADTPAGLFAGSLEALMAIAAEDAEVEPRAELPVEVTGADYADLLVNFLSEVLYQFDAGRFVACGVVIDEISPTRLVGRLTGEPRDAARHRWRLIVKAITYHRLEVVPRDGRWTARVFLDV
jgi:SHS2 domain-containing protein